MGNVGFAGDRINCGALPLQVKKLDSTRPFAAIETLTVFLFDAPLFNTPTDLRAWSTDEGLMN